MQHISHQSSPAANAKNLCYLRTVGGTKIISTYILLDSMELDHKEDRRACKGDKVYAGYPEVR